MRATIDLTSLAADAIRRFLTDHPNRRVKFDDGQRVAATTAAQDVVAWYALIEHTGVGEIRITGAGPRLGARRHTVIGEPRILAGPATELSISREAFHLALGAAVDELLAEVEAARAEALRA